MIAPASPMLQVRNREAGELGKALLLFDRESLGRNSAKALRVYVYRTIRPQCRLVTT